MRAGSRAPFIVSLNQFELSIPQFQFGSSFLVVTFWPVPGQRQSQHPKVLAVAAAAAAKSPKALEMTQM